MKNLTTILMLLCLPIFAIGQQVNLDKLVSLNYNNVTLGTILSDISKQYNVKFSYSGDIIPLDRKITLNIEDEPLGNAIEEIFKETSIEYAIIADQMVLRVNEEKFQETQQLDERIGTIQKAEPLPYDMVNQRPRLVYQKVETPELFEKTELQEPIEKLEPAKPNSLVIDNSAKEESLMETIRDRKVMTPEELDAKSLAQIQLFPTFGTNWTGGDTVTNNFSINLLYGKNGGVDGLEVGTFNEITNDVDGVQVGALGNIVKGDVDGTQIGGLMNQNEGEVKGIQFAGVMNQNNETNTLLQAAGIANISENSKGNQLAGIANITNGTGSNNNVQIAGLLNYVNRGNVRLQIASLVNDAEDVELAQVSALFNRARTVKGMQIGLFNICDSVGVASIGLISIVKKGYNRVEFSGNNSLYFNLGLKLGSHRFYNIFQAGFTPSDHNPNSGPTDDAIWGLGYGIGSFIPIYKRLAINLEATCTALNENHDGFFRELNLLNQVKLTADYRIGKKASLFVGPTFNLRVRDLDMDQNGYSRITPNKTMTDETRVITEPVFAPPTTNLTGGPVLLGTTTFLRNTQTWIGFNAGIRF